MKRTLLKPTADPVFKRIFGQEKEILIELINTFIVPVHPVVDLEFLSQELLPNIFDGKLSIVDVRCTDSMKQHFILEIQLVYHLGFEQRVLLYAAKAFGQQLKRGMKYDEVQPVFMLSIIHHQISRNPEGWLHRFSIREETNPDHEIKGIHLVFIELEKRKKIGNFNMENPIDRWLTFLAEPEKIITMPKFDLSVYPNLMKAVELLDQSNYTEAQLYAYDKHLLAVADVNQAYMENYDRGYDDGEISGIEKGIKIGIEKTISIIEALKNGKDSHESIAEKFQIPLNEVIRLGETVNP